MTTPSPYRILFLRTGGRYADLGPPDCPMISPPRSLLFLAGVFKDDPSVETCLVDAFAHPDWDRIAREKANPPFHFGMSDADLLERIAKFQPQMVAVTSTANYFLEETIRVMDLVKERFPNVFLVVGGPDATNDYREYFERTTAFDALALREGEDTLRELVDRLRQGADWHDVAGLAWRRDTEVVRNPERPYIEDLDRLHPDYSVVDLERYFELGRKGFPSRLLPSYPGSHRSIDLVTSRGCHHPCAFCCIHLHMGSAFRTHSPEHVLAEMRELVEVHGVRNFHFEDDNLLHDMPRFMSILDGIEKAGWDITWDTPNGVRADLITPAFLQKARRTGCAYLIFGAESGSPEVLENVVKKNLTVEDLERACRLAWEHEIDTLAFFIFGMPGETRSQMDETYRFALKMLRLYNATPIFQIWRPYRNTPLELAIRGKDRVKPANTLDISRRHGIPYTLFYSQVYEDDEVTLPFLSECFERYLHDIAWPLFKNWLRVARRDLRILLPTLAGMGWIVLKSLWRPSRIRALLQSYLSGPGLMPFAQLHRLGRRKPKA
ncbi:MAG: radical SAM protein [Fibrobacterota bacterium]|nr:MAG: radical SAM protein [Fibrobacterota bacterium]